MDSAISAGASWWLRLSLVVAVVAATGSIIGLTVDRIYANEVEAFVVQALAQDWVNLIVVCPLLVALAVLALRGSLAAYLLWLGALAFTIYNYAIYAFSIRFGPLFAVWVAILGAATWALVGGVAALDVDGVRRRYRDGPVITVAAWYLIVVGVLFALLWLREIVPALVSSETIRSADDLGLPTNPVHVIDLAWFLPLTVACGLSLRRRGPLGFTAAPAVLLTMALIGLPIAITPLIQQARGDDPVWAVMGVMVGVTAAATAVLVGLIRSVADWR